jgi:tRNA-splicing ligase RtcB (3'-phosphate/5'-hydroxy nucleic acid ligase)
MLWMKDDGVRIPVKSWCGDMEKDAMQQAVDLANHPVTYGHVALMPDCHVGYGMPIGGVIACDNAVIPNAVGVDIGCGMGAVRTDVRTASIGGKSGIRMILDFIKERIPVGEGNAHKDERRWAGFDNYLKSLNTDEAGLDFSDPALPGWMDSHAWKLAKKNLGTLGGGNHFIEMQEDEDGNLWLMLHSGSRNAGNRIATVYHKIAIDLDEKYNAAIPTKNLAFLPFDSKEGQDYIRDMQLAMLYARENRRLMMEVFKEAVSAFIPDAVFTGEINIHHNYANLENHFGRNLWIHRKGATSAGKDEMGIIPGSMGTYSYIVKGLGNPESFMSCSHGAGRTLSRTEANRRLTVEECDRAMGGVVYDRWHKAKKFGGRKEKSSGQYDLSESPLAYKNIDEVIRAELDLVNPVVKLKPIGVLKG